MYESPPPTEVHAQKSSNCCRLGLALASGSAFVAVGGLLRTDATVALVAGLVGAVASLFAYGLARRRSASRSTAASARGDPVRATAAGHSVEVGRLKDSFLSTISHELRTPLTNICAYTEILLHLVPGDEAEWPEFLRIVQTESQRLTRLVDSVMDFVRLENGDTEFVAEEVDLGEVAKRVIDLCAPRARSREIELTLTVAPGLQPMVSDAARLTQVLEALLDNALKFTPGGGHIDVSIAPGERSSVVTVDDSGPGIRPELRERAFEKFTQLRDHLTAKPEGTGLGLATVRLLLDRLGGKVACEDSPLGGARFRFEVPIAKPSVDSVPAALSHARRDERVSAG